MTQTVLLFLNTHSPSPEQISLPSTSERGFKNANEKEASSESKITLFHFCTRPEMGDFNLALVIVAIFVCVLVFIFNIYLLVNYQHPDDKNQAYFPKFVVVLGLSVVILMLPADVANRQACRHAIYNGACNLTLPVKDLCLSIYIVDAILVFFVIPFAMFYYEGDQKKLGFLFTLFLFFKISLVAALCIYASVNSFRSGFQDCVEEDEKCSALGYCDCCCLCSRSGNFVRACGEGGLHCKAPLFNHGILSVIVGLLQWSAMYWNWSKAVFCILGQRLMFMQTTFPEYIVALATIVGSVLFTIFGGVGIACLLLGLVFSFIRHPKAVITRSQYIKEVTELGKKARELKKQLMNFIRKKGWQQRKKWQKNVKSVEKELLLLEEDVKALEEMYTQGEKAEATWAMTVLGYLTKLIRGVLGLIVSVAWIALIDPPLSPFLN